MKIQPVQSMKLSLLPKVVSSFILAGAVGFLSNSVSWADSKPEVGRVNILHQATHQFEHRISKEADLPPNTIKFPTTYLTRTQSITIETKFQSDIKDAKFKVTFNQIPETDGSVYSAEIYSSASGKTLSIKPVSKGNSSQEITNDSAIEALTFFENGFHLVQEAVEDVEESAKFSSVNDHLIKVTLTPNPSNDQTIQGGTLEFYTLSDNNPSSRLALKVDLDKSGKVIKYEFKD